MATNRINQLYQEKRNTWNEANLISQKYDADSNPMSADDKAKFERYIDDVKDIEAQIKTQEDFEKLSAEKSERIEVDGEKRETVEEKEKTHAELIDKWMRSPRSLTPDERKLVNNPASFVAQTTFVVSTRRLSVSLKTSYIRTSFA